MHISSFQALYPHLEQIDDLSSFFGTVKSKYTKYQEENLFSQPESEAIYVYEVRNAQGNVFTGIIACTDLEDYVAGHVKGHEETIVTKEEKQKRLLLNRGAQVKPLVLTYPNVPAVDEWIAKEKLEKPFLELDIDEEWHQIWQVCDQERVALLKAYFDIKIPTAYIADGHHRIAAAANLYRQKPEHRQVLTAYFSFSEVEILDFNRLVVDENEDFLTRLEPYFKIKELEKPKKPKKKFRLTLYTGGSWYRLKWRKEILARYNPTVLDTELLNDHVFQEILGIENIRMAPNISYVGGMEELSTVEQTIDETDGAGFFVYPVSLSDLSYLVDTNQLLPPKSTWFEPRMRNGLLVFAL